MTWRLITFGRSEVLRDGVSIPLGARGAGHAVKLLVYLVLNPEPHDREALARRLWGNSSREERSTILRKQLHELRRLFGAESIRGDGELVWTMELPCDATELLALDRIDDDTLSLYAGDFLQSWHNQDNRHPREFWDWVLRTREELRDRAWRLVNDRAKAVAETGDWNTLERVGERLIQLRSDRDESHS